MAIEPGFPFEQEEFPVTIRNTGDQNLRWWSDAEMIAEPDKGRNGEEDEAGYAYRFSRTPGGPDFNWERIENRNDAMQLETADDWISDEIEFGFDVPWYGKSYSSIRVCSNGWFTFDSDYDGVDAEHPQPPDESEPNSLLIVNGLDLNPEIAGEIWFYTDNDSQAVVSWLGVALVNDEEASSTFQAIINSNGLIEYNYGEMSGHEGDRVTIGFENPDGTLGANIDVEAENYLSEGMTIQLGTWYMFNNWIELEPRQGNLGNEEDEPLITLDATKTNQGAYEADCLFRFYDREAEPVAVVQNWKFADTWYG